MEAVLLKLSQRLNLRIEEVKRILSQILQKETYQEDLLEFIGFENIEDIEEICKHKDYFEEKIQEKRFYTEYNLPEFTSRAVEDEECVDTSILGDDRKYFSYTKFNLVQSKVFESAFNSNENILVCAPTGAGKTDIALLTIIKALKLPNSKVVYIVPMKALASEITFKYKNTLKTKSILEFTGDTEPSSYHLSKSDIIICTPEKFDAYTRKLSNIFQNYLSLIIIDEIHILQDERGPVIESIISRIFRYIELRQQTIRIVGLSATLPNYQDVGIFIRAGKIYNFDQTYRPVSLKTSIIGLHKKASKQIKEEIFRDKIEELRSQNKQVIVFVNSRQDTIYTAKLIVDESISIMMKNQIKLADSLDYLVRHKIGIHHAGLPRETRHFMEEKFKKGDLDVLVSTSTLAWGVNLPAHAVVIRGTTYYDQESGKFKDMGILDIFQIFGRAGRPQYKITGEACLITENEKVGMYLNMIKNNIVIESKLLKHIADILNAEIYLNSVISISTGLSWFKSTFMYTRLLKNPSLYGLSHDERYKEDEVLADYILLSINRLQECLLINIDKTNSLERNTWKFESTEFGRISSFYYLHHSTIRNWLKQLDFVFDEESILKMLLETKDFSNIILRGDEEFSLNEVCEYLKVQFEKTELHKLYILTMAHIRNFQVSKFSLKCDTAYIVKNIERVLSAFIDVLLYIRKYELHRICLFIMKKIKRQKRTKMGKYQVKISTDNKLIVEAESYCDFWCLCYKEDSIVYVRRCKNRLEMFSEFEIDEVEIIQEQSLDVFKCKPLIYIEEKKVCDLEALDITFNIVYFFSYQEFQRKFVYSFDFENSEDVFLICRTKNDVKLIKQEFKTRIGLLNITEGKNIKRHVVSDANSVTKDFICVTTIKEMINIQKQGVVIFLTCRNQNGDYLAIPDILKVCQKRKSIIYEEETFVKYLKEKILIK